MNKFKSFFTFLGFTWLCVCGIWTLWQWFLDGRIVWLGLFVNSLALPVWMSLRCWRPQKFPGDLREAPAFTAVLVGLAITLLADTGRGEPVYLAIYNLFVLLIYLFHLSALSHPAMPAIGNRFPTLVSAAGDKWNPQRTEIDRGEANGAAVIFLRGSFCADSRALVMQLPELADELQRRGALLLVCSTEAESHWRHLWVAPAHGKEPPVEFIQLAADAQTNLPFVAGQGLPFVLRLFSARKSSAAICRPSLWLIDREGRVLWRHLPGNYRTPGGAALLRAQLFRLTD